MYDKTVGDIKNYKNCWNNMKQHVIIYNMYQQIIKHMQHVL